MNTIRFLKNKIVMLTTKSSRVNITAKKKDVSTFLQDFKRRIANLTDSNSDTEHDLIKLKDLLETVHATPLQKKVRAKKDVLKVLEEKFALRDKADSDLQEAKKIYNQISLKFGKNRAAQSIKREVTNLINNIEKTKKKVEVYLVTLAEKQDPYILDDTENPYVDSLIDIIDDGLTGTPKGKWGKFDEYRIDKIKKGLRFSRFMEVRNLPLIKGDVLKKGYFIISSDINKPKADGKLVDGTFSPLVLTFNTNLVNPSKLNVGYKISTKKHIENALAYLAYENNLSLFDNAIKVDGKKRKAQLKKLGKLLIIGDKGVKIRKIKGKSNKIQVTIPHSISGADKGTISQDFIKDLFMDIKRYSGLPIERKSSRLTMDRLKYSFKLGPKHSTFLFTLLPIKPKVVEDDIEDYFLENETESVDDLVRDLANWD